MARSTKLLLTIEVVVSFTPILVPLLLGALLVPMQIYAISDEVLIWQGPATLVGSVVCGAIGLFTLVFVVAKLFLGHN
jgi:hypothetical protein